MTEAKKFTRILENITPKDILPYSWNYYTYTGSLTAPPCYESVRWIVMRCPIKISRKVSSSAIACKNLSVVLHSSENLITLSYQDDKNAIYPVTPLIKY